MGLRTRVKKQVSRGLRTLGRFLTNAGERLSQEGAAAIATDARHVDTPRSENRAIDLVPITLDDVLALLVDPESRQPLARAGDALRVSGGAREYPIVAEVPWLMSKLGRPVVDGAPGASASHVARSARPARTLVLDVGTKTGKHLRGVLDEQSKVLRFDPSIPCAVVGIDLHQDRLLGARANGIFAVRADASRMPFHDGAFDIAVITELLEHVPRELAVHVLREARRVTRRSIFIQNPDFTAEEYLRTAGLKFAWMDWKVHPHHVTADGMRTILEEAGFSSFEVEQIRPVADSSHSEIVPIDAPTDTLVFDAAIHSKRSVMFDQPVFEKLRVVLDIERHAR